MSSFGIPNLPGYRQSRNLNPHGRRVPLNQPQEQPQQRTTTANGRPPMNAGWMNSPPTQQVKKASNNFSSSSQKSQAEYDEDNGWNDVDFSPMNSPAANWVRPSNINPGGSARRGTAAWGGGGSSSSRRGGGDSARSQNSANFEVVGRVINSKSPVVHSAGERPHTFYGHPSSLSNEPDFSVCQHDALRFKVYFLEEPSCGWDNWSPKLASEVKKYGDDRKEANKKPHPMLRKFFLYYYHYDQTIAIQEIEGMAENPDARYLKRSKCYKMDDFGRKLLFTPDDFKPKNKFTVNGQVFEVVDADARSRKWFMETRGEVLAPPMPFPYDYNAPPRLRIDEKTGMLVDPNGEPVSPKNGGLGGFGKDDMRRKQAREQAMKSSKRDVPILLRDETVLRFYAIEAPDKNGGSSVEGYFKGNELMEAPFTLHYFVCDDTIEIAAVAKKGIGPRLLSRQILPKDNHDVPYNDHFTSAKGYKGELTHWKDLRCGATIDVFGRPILLLSADRNTTDWYAKRGITLKPHHDSRFDAADKPPSSRVPVYHGFGEPNMQDEFALGLALEPKEGSGIVGRKGVNPKVPPKNKGIESCTGEGAVMRFMAQRLDIKTGEPLDTEYGGKREFLIVYYLDDDTISVHEPEIRNSGVRGGLFLNKMKYKRHVPCPAVKMPGRHNLSPLSRWFKPIDFSPGSDVTIEFPSNGMPLHRFLIVDCDSFTAAVLDEGGDHTPASAARTAFLANEREARGDPPRPAGIGGRLALIMPRLSEYLEANAVDPRFNFQQLPDNGLSDGLVYEREFRMMIRDGFTPKQNLNKRLNTENIISEDDASLFVYVFNVQSDSDKGAIIDYGTFLDCMKLYHTDSPAFAHHKEWNEKNAGREALPPSLIKETKATYGFGRPKSVCADASTSNNSLVEKVFKKLKIEMKKLKGHDPIDSCLMRKAFRNLDVGHRGLCSLHHWYKIIKMFNLQDILSRDSADLLMRKYAPKGQESYRSVGGTRRIAGSPMGDALDYNALCDAIHQVDFDDVISKLVRISQPAPKPERHLKDIPLTLYKDGARPLTDIEASWTKLTARSVDSDSEAGEKENNLLSPKATSNGDLSDSELERCMQSFCSSFGRTNRKTNLRKHCLAFDTARKGMLNKKWLMTACLTAVRECSVEAFSEETIDRLLDYFLPKSDINKVSYEDWLQVVFTRNLPSARQIREKNLQQHHAWGLDK